MSNNITIELCAEDRARLDRLAIALEALQPVNFTFQPNFRGTKTTPDQLTIDDVQQKLAETLAKAEAPAETPKNATGEAEVSTLPTTPPAVETPTQEEDAPTEEAKPTVTLEQIQQKVVQLAAGNNGAKKAKVREIVNTYAKKVSDLPEDKWSEIWDKLTALESED